MTGNWMVTALLLVGGALLAACGSLSGTIPPDGIREIIAAASTRGSEYLQSPEGAAFLEKLVRQYAPGFDPTLLGGGVAGIGAAVFLGIRNLVLGENKHKASRKRKEQWDEKKDLRAELAELRAVVAATRVGA